MKNKFVLATTNGGKVAELTQMLSPFGIELACLADFPQIGDIEENGQSFAENALIKARIVAKATGLTSIADDSGLVVDALGGAPGIYSARFGDDWPPLPSETRDERNIRKLLHLMKGEKNRGCHFETAIALVSPDGRELMAHGRWDGQIALSPHGQNGFGYDPVFFDPKLGKTAAELPGAIKNNHSHRGMALKNLLDSLPQFLDRQ